MIMRVSGRLFLWGYGGLLVIISFSLIVYGNDQSEDDESKRKPSEVKTHYLIHVIQGTCYPVTTNKTNKGFIFFFCICFVKTCFLGFQLQ